MTPREKIETLRRLREKARKALPGTAEALAAWEACSDAVYDVLDELLDVAEAAAEVRRLAGEYDPDDPHIPTLHALEGAEKALDAALARLGEGEAKGCWCQWEAGDSPCPTHGMDEEKGGRDA